MNSEDEKEQARVKNLIGQFIGWVTEISDCLNSDAWRGEDVMGIFFNEFNRYKKKSEAGQILTPEHIIALQRYMGGLLLLLFGKRWVYSNHNRAC